MNTSKFFNSKWAVRHLPALAAAVAVTLALAFTPREEAQQEFAFVNGEWEEVTGLIEGFHYDCNSGEVCTYADSSFTADMVKPGSFAWR